MFLQFTLLLAGLLLILGGAKILVDGASSLAKKSGISEFVIGLTIVGIGTSTPEMAVSFLASIQGNADMAVGNIIGSNIYNTAFILGITALISPITITRSNLRRDIPINILAVVLLVIMNLNHTFFGLGTNQISRIDGAILLALFIYYLFASFKNDSQNENEEGDKIRVYRTAVSLLLIVGGLAALVFGGSLFVKSAVRIEQFFHVSDAFIAITVMALGTSLPELATCIVAAVKGRNQLALGNILGSNVSNVFLIIGGSALIRPLATIGITPVDYTMLGIMALFLLACAYMFRRKKIDRVEGAILVLLEIGYLVWLIMSLN